MNDFYIFLDIDGVMYDLKFLTDKLIAKKGGLTRHFNPESVKALNNLTNYMSKDFNVNLVISSAWRFAMKTALSTLQRNGVEFDKFSSISHTPITFSPHKREDEILKYFQRLQQEKFPEGTDESPIPKDYIIIDDFPFNYEKYFEKDRFIKTSLKDNSLNTQMIDNFLEKNNYKTQQVDFPTEIAVSGSVLEPFDYSTYNEKSIENLNESIWQKPVSMTITESPEQTNADSARSDENSKSIVENEEENCPTM